MRKIFQLKLPQRMRQFNDRFDIPLVMVHKIFFSGTDITNANGITKKNLFFFFFVFKFYLLFRKCKIL